MGSIICVYVSSFQFSVFHSLSVFLSLCLSFFLSFFLSVFLSFFLSSDSVFVLLFGLEDCFVNHGLDR